jgi:hypothetical protein
MWWVINDCNNKVKYYVITMSSFENPDDERYEAVQQKATINDYTKSHYNDTIVFEHQYVLLSFSLLQKITLHSDICPITNSPKMQPQTHSALVSDCITQMWNHTSCTTVPT